MSGWRSLTHKLTVITAPIYYNNNICTLGKADCIDHLSPEPLGHLTTAVYLHNNQASTKYINTRRWEKHSIQLHWLALLISRSVVQGKWGCRLLKRFRSAVGLVIKFCYKEATTLKLKVSLSLYVSLTLCHCISSITYDTVLHRDLSKLWASVALSSKGKQPPIETI